MHYPMMMTSTVEWLSYSKRQSRLANASGTVDISKPPGCKFKIIPSKEQYSLFTVLCNPS